MESNLTPSPLRTVYFEVYEQYRARTNNNAINSRIFIQSCRLAARTSESLRYPEGREKSGKSGVVVVRLSASSA